jgi:hypothetical protein
MTRERREWVTRWAHEPVAYNTLHKLAQIKSEYEKEQIGRNNKFWGYVAKPNELPFEGLRSERVRRRCHHRRRCLS